MPNVFNTFRSRPHLSVSIVTSIILCSILMANSMRISQALLLSLDAGICIFLIGISRYMARGTPESMLHKARQQASSKWFSLALGLVISSVVLMALYIELHTDKLDYLAPLHIVLAAISVFLAWLFLAFMFALEYAHHFALNRSHQGHDGGLLFPNTPEPDYWDFVYFSTILNMAFQTSDVQITGRHMRRLVLLHSIIAFFFNVVIISICINIVAGTV